MTQKRVKLDVQMTYAPRCECGHHGGEHHVDCELVLETTDAGGAKSYYVTTSGPCLVLACQCATYTPTIKAVGGR